MDLLGIIVVSVYMVSSAVYFGFLFFQREFLQKLAFGAITAGFIGHTISLVQAAVATGGLPARNLHETLSLAAWAVAGVFILFQTRFRLKVLGIYAAPLIALSMFAVSQVPNESVQNPGIFQSYWLIGHVVFVLIGQAALALACGLGILYLLQERAIKTKRRGFFFRRLPSLDLLDAAGYMCIITGFTAMTFGLITGFVYAQHIWGRFWSWDPKEVWSGITWLFYAALLHERLTVGWRGRRAAIMAIVGFGVLLFTFLGVNLLLKGHHGQFTQF